MKARDSRRRRWWQEHWLAVAVAAISLLGLPLTYLSGKSLARLENQVLEGYGYRVEPDEVQPFNRLKVSGSGIVVRIGCSEEMSAKVADHPDDLYIIQRRPDHLEIAGQQLTSREPFVVELANPSKLLHLDVRNGAKVHVEPCAVSKTQVTVNLTAGSQLAMSGETADLFLYASTGSSFLAGAQGPLVVEKAIVDMVFGTSADLCGVTFGVRGSVSLGSVIKVPREITVLDLHAGTVRRACNSPRGEETA